MAKQKKKPQKKRKPEPVKWTHREAWSVDAETYIACKAPRWRDVEYFFDTWSRLHNEETNYAY
jgi:hypothetical protein